jgi:hypothetical protein
MEGKRLIGSIVVETLTVSVDETIAPYKQREAVVHETIHGVLVQMGHDKEDDEPLVTALGVGLLQVIRDNPELIAWLQERQ